MNAPVNAIPIPQPCRSATCAQQALTECSFPRVKDHKNGKIERANMAHPILISNLPSAAI